VSGQGREHRSEERVRSGAPRGSEPWAQSAGGVLVAGVGNVFLGDDGFGPAVAARLAADPAGLPPGARVVDYGIRGVHLGYDLLDGGWDALVLVDAVPGDGPPGSLTLVEVTDDDLPGAPPLDAHTLDPLAVLCSVRALGGRLPARTLVLGCVPADLAEGIGLSAPVAAAVGPAAERARALAAGPLPAGRGA
jgi:hydrogenase maturation protease